MVCILKYSCSSLTAAANFDDRQVVFVLPCAWGSREVFLKVKMYALAGIIADVR